MSHYAQLDQNNVVVFVIAAKSDNKENEFTADTGQVWKQTSYNTRGGVHYDPETGEPSEDQSKAFRGNYAGIGFTYDEALDAFIPEQPYESWILNESTYSWEAPVPYPEDGGVYEWDEPSTSWKAITND